MVSKCSQIEDEENQLWTKLVDLYDSYGLPWSFLQQWCCPEREILALCQQIRRLTPKKILEVGSFVGLSSTMIADAAGTDAVVHCVDPNLPFGVELGALKNDLSSIDPKLTPFPFAERIRNALGFDRRVSLYAGCFASAKTYATSINPELKAPPVIGSQVCGDHGPFDFVFINGIHFTDVVLKDIELAAMNLTPGGMIAINGTLNLNWGHHIRRAIFRFMEDRTDFNFIQDRTWGD